MNKMDTKGDISEIGYFNAEKCRCKEQESLKPSKSSGLWTKFKLGECLMEFLNTSLQLQPFRYIPVYEITYTAS